VIISASRRTDIPAFHAGWILERLREGFAYVRNPFNPRQVSRVSLSPEEAELIVFWTKDAGNMLAHLNELDGMGYPYLFQYTLTPYGSEIERNVDKPRAMESFLKLAGRIGKNRLVWRYDPILLTEKWTAERHMRSFEAMCRRLEGASGRCVVSFVDLYASVKRSADWIQAPDEAQMHEIARFLAETARRYGFLPSACAEALDLSGDGLEIRGCIDRADVEAVLGRPVQAAKDGGQRNACRCIKSVDIGAYDTCAHGCVYCYARTGRGMVPASDPRSPILGPALTGDELITERVERRLTAAQVSMFD